MNANESSFKTLMDQLNEYLQNLRSTAHNTNTHTYTHIHTHTSTHIHTHHTHTPLVHRYMAYQNLPAYTHTHTHRYMAYRNLPATLQQNIRSYFHYKKQHNMYVFASRSNR
jgi:hypothetical protein